MKIIYAVCRSLALFSICFSGCASFAQQTPINLWPEEAQSAPESVRVSPQGDHVLSNIHTPSITPYLPQPENATGAAVIIAPGGGHRELWVDHEGYAVAEWLSSHGIAGFVLKYRLAEEKDSKYTVEGTELADMKRAVRIVRARSKEWGINPEHIGVIGFSAGGEVGRAREYPLRRRISFGKRPGRALQFKAEFPGTHLSRIAERQPSYRRNAASLSCVRRQRSSRHFARTSGILPCPYPASCRRRTPYLRRRRPWLWNSKNQSATCIRLDNALLPMDGYSRIPDSRQTEIATRRPFAGMF